MCKNVFKKYNFSWYFKNTTFCGISHAYICSVVAEINGLSAVKNGFRAHEAHLGWIKIKKKKFFENLVKK